MSGMRIGIDLGGTKIEGIAIADDGSERLRRRIPAPRGDYTSTGTPDRAPASPRGKSAPPVRA